MEASAVLSDFEDEAPGPSGLVGAYGRSRLLNFSLCVRLQRMVEHGVQRRAGISRRLRRGRSQAMLSRGDEAPGALERDDFSSNRHPALSL